MTDKATSDLWWKSAVIYCVDVELFADSNGDGIGDFPALTDRVDYLAGLGITCVWLMPFYPSPNRDNGYDIADYYGVDPRLGTLGEVVEFLRAARERGIRVIADLVVNHTSVDHPWFQSARADRDSPYRDFYCWADEPPTDGPNDIVFPGQETSNWQFDRRAGQYYLHRFYKSMPDLNIANPRVRDEIHKVVGFWLELGMSGFRLDAAPFLIELTGTDQADWRRAVDLDDNVGPVYSSAFLLERLGRLQEAAAAWRFIIEWCQARGATPTAEWPKRELERLRGELSDG